MRVRPVDDITIKGAVYDAGAGDPDEPKGTQIILGKGEGVLVVAETGMTFDIMEKYETRVAFGGWWYSAEFDHLFALDGSGAPVQSANYGFYCYLESNVYQEADDPLQGLNIFVRAGTAEDDVNQFDYLRNTGISLLGIPYFDFDGKLKHDTGIYERPESLDLLNPKLYWNIIKNTDAQKARYMFKLGHGRSPTMEELHETVKLTKSHITNESDSILNYLER